MLYRAPPGAARCVELRHERIGAAAPGGTGTDKGRDIVVDGDGTAYLTGETASSNFPTANAWQPALRGASDSYVAKLSYQDPTLTLDYSSYLGGTGDEQGL